MPGDRIGETAAVTARDGLAAPTGNADDDVPGNDDGDGHAWAAVGVGVEVGVGVRVAVWVAACVDSGDAVRFAVVVAVG